MEELQLSDLKEDVQKSVDSNSNLQTKIQPDLLLLFIKNDGNLSMQCKLNTRLVA